MRTINVFKLVAKRIEYTDAIKAAVLDPRITGLKLHVNGGYDWIDQKYGFIKLLLSRGQVESVVTYSDLLACDDYIEAVATGRSLRYIMFDTTTERVRDRKSKTASYASILRCERAEKQFHEQLKLIHARNEDHARQRALSLQTA